MHQTETAQKKVHTSTQTQFKLVIYFSHREDLTPYTEYEIKNNMNRKYRDSVDTVALKKGGNRIDHREAYYGLINYCRRCRGVIMKANLIVNDWDERMELTIGKIIGGTHATFDGLIAPDFSEKDEKGNVYYTGISCEPLRIDEMRVQNLDFKSDKSKKWIQYQANKKNALEQAADQLLGKFKNGK